MERLRRLAETWTIRRRERRMAAALRSVARRPDRSLRDDMEVWAKRYGDRVALVDRDGALTFQGWNAGANRYGRWARSLALGKGDVAAVLYPQGAELVTCWTGLVRSGVATALLDERASAEVLARCLRASYAKVVLVHADFCQKAREMVRLLDVDLPIFCFGKYHRAGAAGLPRLDLMLGGFSCRDIPRRERMNLASADACLVVFEPDLPSGFASRELSHGDVARLMGESAAALAAFDEIHLPDGLIRRIGLRALGAACVNGATLFLQATEGFAAGPRASLALDDTQTPHWRTASAQFAATLVTQSEDAAIPDLSSKHLFVATSSGDGRLRIVPRTERNCANSARSHLHRDTTGLYGARA